jgi:hypothetical protein
MDREMGHMDREERDMDRKIAIDRDMDRVGVVTGIGTR